MTMSTTANEAQTTLVNYKKEGGIAILTLTDPPANTYTHEMMKDLDACII
jgi:enoyl-CoA hydratase